MYSDALAIACSAHGELFMPCICLFAVACNKQFESVSHVQIYGDIVVTHTEDEIKHISLKKHQGNYEIIAALSVQP